MADVEALRTLRAEGVPSLLAGPPGTGKSSLVEAAFPDLITVAGDGDTTVGGRFVGEYTQKPDGTYEFIYGPLIRAMQEGPGPFHRRRHLDQPGGAGGLLPGHGRPPRGDRQGAQGRDHHRRQRLLRGSRPQPGSPRRGPWTEGPGPAASPSSSRSRPITTLGSGPLGIDSRAITAARNLATRQANGETGWAPQLRELLAFAKITRIFGLDTALANLAGVAPAEDRDVVADTLAKTFGKTVAPLALGRQI